MTTGWQAQIAVRRGFVRFHGFGGGKLTVARRTSISHCPVISGTACWAPPPEDLATARGLISFGETQSVVPVSGSAATAPRVSTREHSSLIGFSRVRFSREISEPAPALNLFTSPREPTENRVRRGERRRLGGPTWKEWSGRYGGNSHNEWGNGRYVVLIASANRINPRPHVQHSIAVYSFIRPRFASIRRATAATSIDRPTY